MQISIKTFQFFIFVLLTTNFKVCASGYKHETLRIATDTFFFHETPFQNFTIHDACLQKHLSQGADLWNEPELKWELKQDSLFITDVISKGSKKSILLPFKQCKKLPSNTSPIFAFWVEGEFWLSHGEWIENDLNNGDIYRENETCLTFINGRLSGRKDYPAVTFYDNDQIDVYVRNLIYQNIDWKLFHNFDTIYRHFFDLEITIHPNGEAECTQIPALSTEYKIRDAIKAIIANHKQWNRFTFEGKALTQRYLLRIEFNKKIMESIGKQ